jgi:prolyl oligopeptidase
MSTESYPQVLRQDITEEIHGHLVPDPYRWLEDAGSAQTTAWLAAQDELYAAFLAARPGLDRLAARLAELMASGSVSTPSWRGDRRFLTRRTLGQEHAVLYTHVPDEGERALIDPMAIDQSGSTTLDRWQPDHMGRLVAYQMSEGGREDSVLRVLDVVTGKQVDGPIDRCRYSPVAWLPGGQAFYYARKLAPGQVPAGEEQYHRRVFLHRIGTPADADVQVFGDGLDKTNYYGVSVSWDGRWLIITAAAGAAPRNDIWIADLTASPDAAPALRPLQLGVDAQTDVWAGRNGQLYLFTDRDAPRGRLAVADPADPAFPDYPAWRDLLEEQSDAVLGGYAVLDGSELDQPVLLAARTRHAISELSVHDLASGELIAPVALPGLGSIAGLSGRPEGGHEAWFEYVDFATPTAILHYDARTAALQTWESAPGTPRLPPVKADQVAFSSADGTVVRMIVVSAGQAAPGHVSTDQAVTDSQDRGGTDQDGPDHLTPADVEAAEQPKAPRPALLFGYGGFGVSMTPAFSPQVLAWVEAGGLYAIAGLRGGGEEGEDWHRAGTRERKQNVFDDFHAAAEKLIADGWTTSDQLAIWGGSNGGLVVGASITQRPELTAAAVCSAPLLDMVRYERSGLGETWSSEYGTAADPEELGWLLSYSPYHHVTDGVRYPAVLFTVFDGDTRVDALHARKMCASLQDATTAAFADRPVLLRREGNVGHGARAVSRRLALAAEILAFAAAGTGLHLY